MKDQIKWESYDDAKKRIEAEQAKTAINAQREANLIYMKQMMKSHEEWKARHPHTKKTD